MPKHNTDDLHGMNIYETLECISNTRRIVNTNNIYIYIYNTSHASAVEGLRSVTIHLLYTLPISNSVDYLQDESKKAISALS